MRVQGRPAQRRGEVGGRPKDALAGMRRAQRDEVRPCMGSNYKEGNSWI